MLIDVVVVLLCGSIDVFLVWELYILQQIVVFGVWLIFIVCDLMLGLFSIVVNVVFIEFRCVQIVDFFGCLCKVWVWVEVYKEQYVDFWVQKVNFDWVVFCYWIGQVGMSVGLVDVQVVIDYQEIVDFLLQIGVLFKLFDIFMVIDMFFNEVFY